MKHLIIIIALVFVLLLSGCTDPDGSPTSLGCAVNPTACQSMKKAGGSTNAALSTPEKMETAVRFMLTGKE